MYFMDLRDVVEHSDLAGYSSPSWLASATRRLLLVESFSIHSYVLRSGSGGTVSLFWLHTLVYYIFFMGLVQHCSLQMPQYPLICPFCSVGTDIIGPISRCWRLSGGETYRQLVWRSVCPTVNSSENQSLKAQITDRTDGLKESTAKQTLPGCDARWTTRSPEKINIFNVFTWFFINIF